MKPGHLIPWRRWLVFEAAQHLLHGITVFVFEVGKVSMFRFFFLCHNQHFFLPLEVFFLFVILFLSFHGKRLFLETGKRENGGEVFVLHVVQYQQE